MDDLEKFEQECQRIRQVNKRLLKEFEAWLKSSGLRENTLLNRPANIDIYVNEFLFSDFPKMQPKPPAVPGWRTGFSAADAAARPCGPVRPVCGAMPPA